jgi:hypothetical protein
MGSLLDGLNVLDFSPQFTIARNNPLARETIKVCQS